MDSAYDPTINRVDEQQQPSSQQATKMSQAADTAAASASAQQEDPTLEEEVKQLVGSVTSWWSGFSKKSAEQINTARAQIEKQGGIVSYAKQEAARLEAQLSEAQKQARERAQATGEVDVTGGMTDFGVAVGSLSPRQSGEEGEEDGTFASASKGKGKGRAMESGDRQQRVSGSEVDASGEALFDADAPLDESTNGEAVAGQSQELTPEERALEAARQGTKVALANVQSFWERIQTNLNSDPRIKEIQHSLASTLQSVSASASTNSTAQGQEGDSKEASAEKTQGGGSNSLASAGDALPALARTLQSRLPHLDWKESQNLARKYYTESQAAAKDWTKEMGDFVGELVKIVPPAEEEAGKSKESQAKEKPVVDEGQAAAPKKKEAASTAAAATSEKLGGSTTSSYEEDDFDWEREADTRLETTTAPPTTSWGGSASGSEEQLATSNKTPTNAAVKSKPQEKHGDEVEDEDSDWE